ncbi:MAG: LysM peptidoglycan-binding domain-containing protein, partial [Planctomycetes bacterium]|nr:LysM peptidoglycan-binding domain-containing protein [Planctomycetota bacterium]
MGKFIFFVIILAGGWYLYPSASETNTSDTSSGTTADGNPDFSAPGDEAQVALAGGGGEAVPGSLNAALDKAEKEWEAYKAEKTDATLHELAPSLARDYSNILKQTYNKANLKKIQLRLVNDRLVPLAQRIFFSSKTYNKDTSGLFSTHSIKSGENLDAIGRQYGLSYEMINILRGKTAQNEIYNVGDELKIVLAKQKGYDMHIDKSDFFMDVFICGVF